MSHAREVTFLGLEGAPRTAGSRAAQGAHYPLDSCSTGAALASLPTQGPLNRASDMPWTGVGNGREVLERQGPIVTYRGALMDHGRGA